MNNLVMSAKKDKDGRVLEFRDYKIDIGYYDALSEMSFVTPYGIANRAKRDWISLKFNWDIYKHKATWSCKDGFSDYKKDAYNLTSINPNVEDLNQDCSLLNDKGIERKNGEKLSVSVELSRKFNTKFNTQDLQLFVSQDLVFQTRVSQNLCTTETNCTASFNYHIDGELKQGSQVKVIVIIATLVCTAWLIIFVCRCLEVRADAAKGKNGQDKH